MMIAYGSGSELESQLEIAEILFPGHACDAVKQLLTEILKILNHIINKPRY